MRISFWENSCLLLVLILPTFADQDFSSTTVKNIDHLPRKISFNQGINYSRVFACSEPQPRAYNLQDLMEGVHLNLAESPSYPVYIILKRCDVHTGCCPSSDLSCSPVTSSNYTEEVEIKIGSVGTRNNKRTWIRVEHHGKCECKVTSVNDRICQENQRPLIVFL